jgi:hypothetical protein
MNGLTTALLSQACHTFLVLAYPGGEQSIPVKKRVYFNIPVDGDLAVYLPPAPAAHGVGQAIKGEEGCFRGYAFRLGSAHFPHLKLQVTAYLDDTCVFAVDTHDAFPRGAGAPPLGCEEYELWTALQKNNRQLKERIERAWEQEGLWTFNKLLRMDVDTPAPDLGDRAPATGP